jgi:Asp-tRNA(Asn)/Glu-tRNA(Gln) amidotransferase A subunit family amidase
MNPHSRNPIEQPSRRTILKSAVWAAPLCLTGGVLPLLGGCSERTAAPAEDLTELGARAAAERIGKGELSSETYTQALLKQYNAHKDLNAVVFIDEARVLEQARGADKARAAGQQLGRAGGVPFAVKDQIMTAGYPSTGGHAALKGYIPKESAVTVEAVVREGGIIFAKTNLPDMVAGSGNLHKSAESFNPFYGPTRNPYDLSRGPGGSSGGNGAAIAARMVPFGIGEDSGGSVRFPAAYCGIAGLRPSTHTLENALNGTNKKHWSDHGFVPGPAGYRDTFGPMARTVADCAWLDTLVTGQPVPTVMLNQVRIGIPRPDYWQQDFVDQDLAKVMLDAYAKLRDAGATLVEIDFEAVRNIGEGSDLNRALVNPQTRDLRAWLAENLPGVSIEQLYEGREVPTPQSREPMDPARRAEVLTAAMNAYADAFRSNDIVAIAIPCIPILPPTLNYEKGEVGQTTMVNGKEVHQTEAMTKNISFGPRVGAPGLSLPAGLARGLPVGFELEGLPGDDSRILGLGIAVENVLGPLPGPQYRPVAA